MLCLPQQGTNAAASAGMEAAQEGEVKLALLMLTPHMNPQLFPEVGSCFSVFVTNSLSFALSNHVLLLRHMEEK